VLYNKTISPNFGYDLSTKESSIFDNYIKNKYSDKAADIKYYTMGEDAARTKVYPNRNIVYRSNWESKDFPLDSDVWSTSDYMYPDVGGHNIQFGYDNKSFDAVVRGADIWKFNPEDYIKKWEKEMWDNKPLTYK